LTAQWLERSCLELVASDVGGLQKHSSIDQTKLSAQPFLSASVHSHYYVKFLTTVDEHSVRALLKSTPLIGIDARGYWGVRDRNGLREAVFAHRSEALRFAMLEDIRNPRAVIMIPGVLRRRGSENLSR
jgi:hypothetical protein